MIKFQDGILEEEIMDFSFFDYLKFMPSPQLFDLISEKIAKKNLKKTKEFKAIVLFRNSAS
jgi:hypothetical protein